jgi:nickel-dependent lactate racemase
MIQLQLPFGHGTLAVRIPDEALGEVVAPRAVTPVADAEAEFGAALDNPIGSPRLEAIARPGQRVAILVDDITRETPTARMLPQVLARLQAAGVAPGDIRIVLALGTHRQMTEAEIVEKVGAETARQFEVVNDSCWDESKFVYLGDSSNGIPAWVNRAVAEADVRIGLGGIIPHTDAGFGGGAKIILPGVCSGRTVDVFHTRCAAVTHNLLGDAEGPIRRDLEQFVEERVPLHFMLNVVLTADFQVYRCVAGHFRQAHRAGVKFAQEVYGVPVARRYPIVIANSHPSFIDLWQCSKGMWTGEALVSDGGMLVLVTPCPEGINIHPLYADYMNRDPDELQAELDAGRAEDPNAAAGAIPIGRMKRRIRLGLVSTGLTRADADRMGFAYFDSVEAAIAAQLPPGDGRGSVAVMPAAGFTIPLVSAESG